MSKLARLLDLRAPSMLVEGQSSFLQHEFDDFFDAMVEALRLRLSPT